MEGLPSNYRENITIDNGVEIIWVNQKGQIIQGEKASQDVVDEEAVVGMPRVPSIKTVLPPAGRVVTGADAGTMDGASLPTSPGGTRRKSVVGTISSAPGLIGAWFTSSPDGAPPTSPTSPVDNEDDDADPDGHPCMALEPFARDNYHTTRTGLLGKKRTPMETLLSWKGKQITSPLTIACREDKILTSECVAAFGTIMGYMGDKRTKDPGMQLLKSLQMRMLEGGQLFRDEMFCQVCLLATFERFRTICTLRVALVLRLIAGGARLALMTSKFVFGFCPPFVGCSKKKEGSPFVNNLHYAPHY